MLVSAGGFRLSQFKLGNFVFIYLFIYLFIYFSASLLGTLATSLNVDILTAKVISKAD